MHELLVGTYLWNLVNDPDPTYQQMINYVLSFKKKLFFLIKGWIKLLLYIIKNIFRKITILTSV